MIYGDEPDKLFSVYLKISTITDLKLTSDELSAFTHRDETDTCEALLVEYGDLHVGVDKKAGLVGRLYETARRVLKTLIDAVARMGKKFTNYITDMVKDFDRFDTTKMIDVSINTNHDAVKSINKQLGGLANAAYNGDCNAALHHLVDIVETKNNLTNQTKIIAELKRNILNWSDDKTVAIINLFKDENAKNNMIYSKINDSLKVRDIKNYVNDKVSDGYAYKLIIDSSGVYFSGMKYENKFVSAIRVFRFKPDGKATLRISRRETENILNRVKKSIEKFSSGDMLDVIAKSQSDTNTILRTLVREEQLEISRLAIKASGMLNKLMYDEYKSYVRSYRTIYNSLKIIINEGGGNA
jgi:TusA-related sulfurtransferase